MGNAEGLFQRSLDSKPDSGQVDLATAGVWCAPSRLRRTPPSPGGDIRKRYLPLTPRGGLATAFNPTEEVSLWK